MQNAEVNPRRFPFKILILLILIPVIVVLIFVFTKGNTEKNTNQNNSSNNGTPTDSRNSDIVAVFTPASKTAFQYNSPTISDNYIYIGTSTKISLEGDPAGIISSLPDNYFYKLDLNLNIIWQHSLGKSMVGGAGVFDREGNIYFTTIEFKPAQQIQNVKGFYTDVYLYSIDQAGSFRWKYKISADNEVWDHGMINVAVSPDSTIYVGDKKLYAFNKSGEIKWQYPSSNQKIIGNRSTPSIDNSGSVYFISPQPVDGDYESNQLNVYKFNTGSSTPSWITKLPIVPITPQEGGGSEVHSTYGTPAFNNDFSKVVVTASNTVYSLDTKTGSIAWSYQPQGVIGLFKASAVMDKDGNVFVGSKANERSAFYAIRADGSGLLWKYETRADVYPTALIGDDNRVYFGSETSEQNGHFHSIDIATGNLIWNTGYGKNPMVDISFGSPALINGYIYLGGFSVTGMDEGPQAFYKIKVNANNYQTGAMWPRFGGGNLSNSRKGLAVQTSTEIPVVIAPYTNEEDVSSINEAYSMDPHNPYWGFSHPGIDFMLTKPFIPVLASVGGTVVNLEIRKEAGIMGWHAGFAIEYNKTYSICYNLETFGNTDQVEQNLRNNVFIKTGDVVEQGQQIANLIYGGGGAHIDFGVCTAGTRVCPEPYFPPAVRESVLRLIHKKQPTWPMCY